MSFFLVAGIAFAIFFMFFVIMARDKSEPVDREDKTVYECHFCDDEDCDCHKTSLDT